MTVKAENYNEWLNHKKREAAELRRGLRPPAPNNCTSEEYIDYYAGLMPKERLQKIKLRTREEAIEAQDDQHAAAMKRLARIVKNRQKDYSKFKLGSNYEF